MNKTYQPFILKKADEIFEILKEDIKYSDFMKNRLCNMLTKKFIDGELCSEDPVNTIFKNEDELLSFINEALVYEDIKHLMELGFVGYLDEDNDDVSSFFITEKGRQYVEEMMKEK
jgi:hypothetical protein